MNSRLAIVIALALVSAVACGKKVIPRKYPLYKQCDPYWGDTFMNGTRPDHDTICATGCAMTSLAMALGGHGLKVPGTDVLVDPDTLNHWLQRHDGYLCYGTNCNNLVLDAPERLFPGKVKFLGEEQKPPVEEMIAAVQASNPAMIIHVNNNHHFVFVIGVELPAAGNETVFYVHDPDSENFMRTYGEISDIIRYTIKD